MRYWLHNEFVLLDAQKIAKSAGHTLRLADLVESGYHPMAYRLFLLGGHYRSQLDFTMTAMDAAQATLRRLITRVAPLRPLPPVETLDEARALADAADDKTALAYVEAIDAAIASDLATPKLLATLQDALRDPELSAEGLRVVVAAADALLGLRLGDLHSAEVEQRRTAADLAPAGGGRHRAAHRRAHRGPHGAELGPRRRDPRRTRRPRRRGNRHPRRADLAAPLRRPGSNGRGAEGAIPGGRRAPRAHALRILAGCLRLVPSLRNSGARRPNGGGSATGSTGCDLRSPGRLP